MTSQQINHLVALANEIGKPAGLLCKYEWSRKNQKFVWAFYRRGMYLGETSLENQVIKKMERYATAH